MSVSVSPHLLEKLGREDLRPGSEGGSPAFRVRSADHEAAARALHAAALRFINIDEQGEELEEWSDTAETYTPNYVSDVFVSPDGPWLSIDTQGVLYPQMVRVMIRILVETLQRSGVDAHVEVPPRGLSVGETWQPPTPPSAAAEPDGPRAWVIRRGRHRVTTTGRGWEDDEYFCNDGTWSRDCREALMFPEMPPTELVRAIIADKADTAQQRLGQIFSVFVRVDGYERPGAKPPAEIRRDD